MPQGDVLAEADVMLCHGGLGSMLGAMEVGCPAVVVPLGGDQLHNAEKAKCLGIARVVDPAEATPDRLRDELALALASEEQRKACDAIRTEVGGLADLAELVSDLETLKG